MRAVAIALLACLIAMPAMAETCRASWYGGGERLNKHTASGQVFKRNGKTAAHRTLPFGTKVRVCRKGACVEVRINDRGPAKWTGKCIDLSRGAAEALGMIRRGVASVRIQILK